jgi:hypothetical protein
MKGRSALERFLSTDPRDAGCEETMALVHVYAELILAGVDPEERYPGLATHLRACDPCAQDLEGLLAALRGPAAS